MVGNTKAGGKRGQDGRCSRSQDIGRFPPWALKVGRRDQAQFNCQLRDRTAPARTGTQERCRGARFRVRDAGPTWGLAAERSTRESWGLEDHQENHTWAETMFYLCSHMPDTLRCPEVCTNSQNGAQWTGTHSFYRLQLHVLATSC